MTVVTPDSETISLEDLDFDFVVACEIPARRAATGGFPMCDADPAEWVGWRAACCPQSPRYLLMCSRCKETYQMWQAMKACIVCADCGAETGGPISYTPLNKKS